MLVNRATTLRTLITSYWPKWVLILAIVLAAEVINAYRDPTSAVFSLSAVGMLMAALSIFLVFRVNEAYARWWEARTLWGGVVNASRSFARQVLTLLVRQGDSPLSASELAALQKEMIYRHLAYVNALRLSLRGQTDWDSLAPFVDGQELRELKRRANKPAHLIQTQAERLRQAHDRGLLDVFRHVQLDRTLVELIDHQGGCERIKNTEFPDAVAFFTKVIAWSMAAMLAVSVMESDRGIDVVEALVVAFMMAAFVLTEKMGSELKNPFSNRANDTPMTALCRTIEIDLRELLGETDVPAPLTPVDGVLM